MATSTRTSLVRRAVTASNAHFAEAAFPAGLPQFQGAFLGINRPQSSGVTFRMGRKPGSELPAGYNQYPWPFPLEPAWAPTKSSRRSAPAEWVRYTAPTIPECRDVAIKVSSERFSDRFSREVHAVAALNHPNICHLYDVGPDYLVMELVEGPTLAERIQIRKVSDTGGSGCS
jgi:serine/threonine protein kinase